MQRIDVITTARADYALTAPVAFALSCHPGLSGRMVFSGSHFASAEAANLESLQQSLSLSFAEVPCSDIGTDETASALALGEMTAGFARLWEIERPAMIVLLGDRYELLPPAQVAVLYGIPIAHMFGAEVDVSHCLDTQVRDAITKMAHVHFISHEAVRQRLTAMGEEEWRIMVSGNPAVDQPEGGSEPFITLAREQGWKTERLIAACFLPPTTQREQMFTELDALLEALRQWPEHTVIWAGVNADPGGSEIRALLQRHCASNPRHHFVEGLGHERFRGLLQSAEVLVGNSSSGLLEAASYGLPVVNVGVRQTGRLSGDNVFNVPGRSADIQLAMVRAMTDKAFLAQVRSQGNPFYRGDGAERVATGIGRMLQMKRDQLLLKRAIQDNPRRFGGLQRVPEYLLKGEGKGA